MFELEEDVGSEKFVRIAVHSIGKLDELSPRFQQRYSHMKHGDPKAIWESAEKIIAAMFTDLEISGAIERGESIVLTSSAFGSVPSAIHAVVKAMKYLLQEKKVDVSVIKIDRAGDFGNSKYGALSPKERKGAISNRQIFLSETAREAVKDKLVVCVDDIRVTGRHEKSLRKVLESTSAKFLRFCYLVCFSKELADMNPAAEEALNHAAIRTLGDLLPFTTVDFEVNARTIKLILTTTPHVDKSKAEMLKDLREYLAHDDDETVLKFYEAAISNDGYCTFPQYIDGFHVLANVAISRGLVSLKDFQRVVGTTCVWNMEVQGGATFLDMDTGEDLAEVAQNYSLMKMGSYKHAVWFAGKVAAKVITALKAGEGLFKVFETARQDGDSVVLVTPGHRNVESAQYRIFEMAVVKINSWLALNGFPTIIFTRFTRFASADSNYAELSAGERTAQKREQKKTSSVLPGAEFFSNGGVHLIFADDVKVSGATADRIEIHALENGAKSFSSLYCVVVDPKVAIPNPKFENDLNKIVVKDVLDSNVAFILNQSEFKPVQRLIRMMLNEKNRSFLAEFLKNIRNESVIKLYESALANDYFKDPKYMESIPIVLDELKLRELVDAEGVVKLSLLEV